jgi:hypothetical protein
VPDVSGAVKLNTRQDIDARLATLTTLAKPGRLMVQRQGLVQGGA